MTGFTVSRRSFNRDSLLALLAATAATSLADTASAQQPAAPGASAGESRRRDVIKQELPGESPRDILLVEVTYPPGSGSPPHLHANGVVAFVVAGTIASKVGDGAEQTFGAGSAWWEPPGAIHRVSRNASTTESAKLLAIYVAPKGAPPADLMKPL